MSGIRGLQGVVRKTVDDELQVNIWEPRHMEQIVPALLVNLQQHSQNDRYRHVLMLTLLYTYTFYCCTCKVTSVFRILFKSSAVGSHIQLVTICSKLQLILRFCKIDKKLNKFGTLFMVLLNHVVK